MALAEGRWAWWNRYGTVPLASCVQRAKEARLRGVIVTRGYPEVSSAFARSGIPWATAAYVYPDRPDMEARRLAQEIVAGARFAAINAEAEWERLGPEPMERLIAEFRRHQPTAELYASVDTRASRMALPYQRVLAEHVTGWLPMVYPKAFGQSVRDAFAASLDGKSFGGKPVLPTIQTYGHIGAEAVAQQTAEVRRRGLPGYQAYTIAHATDAEWSVLTDDAEEDDMAAIDKLQRIQAVAGLFLQAAGHAQRGERLPEGLRAQLKYLLV